MFACFGYVVWQWGYIHISIEMKTTSNSIYKQTARFAEVTLQFIRQGKTDRMAKCLSVADRLLVSGSPSVKNAMSNVFLIYLSNFLETHYEQGRQIIQLFPKNLRAEYDKQVYASAL